MITIYGCSTRSLCCLATQRVPDIQPYRADGVGALTVRRPGGLGRGLGRGLGWGAAGWASPVAPRRAPAGAARRPSPPRA